MRKRFTHRFWIELGFASASGLLAIITAIYPNWIESISGLDLDRQDGSLERSIVAGLLAIAAAMFALAAIEWRRSPAAISE
jgi:hypothetical protein